MNLVVCLLMFAALPEISQIDGFPITPATIITGRELFNDPILSINGAVSCATCHEKTKGWADGLPKAISPFIPASRNNPLNQGPRNTPSIVNAAYKPLQFLDCRTIGIASQSALPITNAIEMGNQTQGQVINRLRRSQKYQQLFAIAYPGRGINLDTYGHAQGSFMSTITSRDSRVDRFRDGNRAALTSREQIGMGIYMKNCELCHKWPYTTDMIVHNNGMEYAGRIQVRDDGRAAIDRNRGNARAFVTASLRDVHRTAPYAHHGMYNTLREVIDHYDRGGARYDGTYDSAQDPRIKPLRLDEFQKQCLEEFLVSLGALNFPQ